MREYRNQDEVVAVLKEAVWLAWNAARKPFGMGTFQDMPEATKEDVWNNVTGIGDYPVKRSRDGCIVADYVFGRMMKLSLCYGDNFIDDPDMVLRGDYQSWCSTYRTFTELLDTAEKNLGVVSGG